MQANLLAALSIAKGVTEFIGQKQTASDQIKQNAELRQNALETRDNDLATIEARRKEEREAAAQKAQQTQRQTLQERSAAIAASSQAGQAGLSVNALLADYLRQSLENEQSIQSNLSNVNSQLDRERVSVINTAKSRVNAAPSVTNPSFLGSALKIGGDAYTDYRIAKADEQAKLYSPKGK